MRKRRPFLTLVVALLATAIPVSVASAARGGGLVPGQRPASAPRCPWLDPPPSATPLSLAREVLAAMTPAEKLDVVTLTSTKSYENATVPVPALCIPSLTMQDGPDGLAYGDTGVTQFPAAIGLAASFDPTLARAEGAALGAEARAQGVDAVQGPYLNLARVPQAGRVFEGYGEDPMLSGTIGAADVEGIQSAGVLADVKDLGIYTQESNRDFLNQVVSRRALEELYLAPYRMVAADADPASFMCGFGSINGTQTCEDPLVFESMRAAGFRGFFRDDINAAPDGVAALAAGLDLFKPGLAATSRGASLTTAARSALIDRAATAVLTEMFRFGLIEHPLIGKTGTPVQNASEEAAGLAVAERGAVLLKDDRSVLPLSSSLRSIAVIGTPALASPLSSGGGSSHVSVASVVTPLAAIRATWPRATVTAVPGEPAANPAAEIPTGEVTPALPAIPPPLKHPVYHTSKPPAGVWRTWTGTLHPPVSGWYRLSVVSHGDTDMSIDGKPVLEDPGNHGPTVIQLGYDFVGGHSYSMSLHWLEYDENVPRISWRDVSPMIAAAARAARNASVAVVFAGNESTEGADNPSLALSGVQDALIEAVAAANPSTVVVLDTGGAVLMPWIDRVAGVLEAWYPGQDDGTAVAALLSGAADPSGRLPVSFPTSANATSLPGTSSYPGVNMTVDLGASGGDGLDVGYRYYDAHHVPVLFPFGFGESYTTFRFSRLELVASSSSGGAVVEVRVTNAGGRAGTAVVEAYLADPPAAHEPPDGLAAFSSLPLAPRASADVRLVIPRAAFETYRNGRFGAVAGTYRLLVGPSSGQLPLSVLIRRR